MQNNYEHQMLSLDSLVPFDGHPFEIYQGQRFTDMVESVRANGVIVPIVVRPKADGNYEILSGHNRFNAAKEVRNEKGDLIPVIVRNDLSEDIRYKGGNGKPPKISWQRLIRSGFQRFPRTNTKGGQYVKLVGITALTIFCVSDNQKAEAVVHRGKFPTASKATPKGAG